MTQEQYEEKNRIRPQEGYNPDYESIFYISEGKIQEIEIPPKIDEQSQLVNLIFSKKEESN